MNTSSCTQTGTASNLGRFTDRDPDFVAFVIDDVGRRRHAEEAAYRRIDPDTGEIT